VRIWLVAAGEEEGSGAPRRERVFVGGGGASV